MNLLELVKGTVVNSEDDVRTYRRHNEEPNLEHEQN